MLTLCISLLNGPLFLCGQTVGESVLANGTEWTRQRNRKAAIMSHYCIVWRVIGGAWSVADLPLGLLRGKILNQPSCACSSAIFPLLLHSPCAISDVSNWPISWNTSFARCDTEVHPFLPTHNTFKLWLQIIPVKIADLYDSWGISYFNLKLSVLWKWWGSVCS